MYKPIQVAEVLYHFRNRVGLPSGADIERVESYRNVSKAWRDAVTSRLSGRNSTSSMRYQDDVFNNNAVPAAAMVELARQNVTVPGQVERYIYVGFAEKASRVGGLREYIASHGTGSANPFQLGDFIGRFIQTPGLKTSVDKAYEILVFSLFTSIVQHAKLTVTLAVDEAGVGLLRDFGDFARIVLGLGPGQSGRTLDGNIFRVGVTNAADTGLDMWTNFGPAIQVKHITLNRRACDRVTTEVQADEIILVCEEADIEVVHYFLQQTGNSRVRRIVTEEQLAEWYGMAMGKYRNSVGRDALAYMGREFDREFPANLAVEEFLEERGYRGINPDTVWQTDVDVHG